MEKYTNEKEQVFVEIAYDEYSENPREWDNLWAIYTWTDRYNSIDTNKFSDFEEFLLNYFTENQIENIQKHATSGKEHFETLQKYFNKIGYLVAPINKFEHGNVCYSVSTGQGWDYGICGIAILSYEQIKREYYCKNISKSTKEKVYGMLNSELDIYTSWCNGEVYYIEIKNFGGGVIDSEYGLIGYENEEEMIKEFIDDCTEYDFEDFKLTELEENIVTSYSVAY